MKRTVRQRITHAATYTKRGQYWYKGDDTKHPCEQRLCATCGKTFFGRRDQPGLFCSKHCMQMGENNTMWKGKDAGYMAQHGRVYRELGPANSCPWDHPGPYQWAHNTGERGLPDEYVSMCVPCHRRFDTAMAKCLPHLCGNGLHMLDTNADFYVKIRADGTEIRQCRQCAKDRAAILRQRAERHPVVGALLVESAHSWIATLSPEGASTPERGRLVMQPDGTASIVAPRRRQHFSRTDSERPLPDPFEE